MPLTTLAKKLRSDATPHEHRVWQILRAHRFAGYKFRRQFPIGPYIVDFCCPRQRLVVELDGGGHVELQQSASDQRRDDYLRQRGFRILRVWNTDVDTNLEGVAQAILSQLTT